MLSLGGLKIMVFLDEFGRVDLMQKALVFFICALLLSVQSYRRDIEAGRIFFAIVEYRSRRQSLPPIARRIKPKEEVIDECMSEICCKTVKIIVGDTFDLRNHENRNNKCANNSKV